ncbi:MAG: zinc-ribbon domain-containing protein [Planctomycetota bacterium]
MILVGTVNLTRTRDTGQFYCPTCGVDQEYRLRSRKPFLTVYFIPVVPIGKAETFVDCRGCREKWDETVLEMRRNQHLEIQEDQFREEALRSAVLLVIEDGMIDDAEITALRRVSSGLLGQELDREELGELCSAAEQNKIRAVNYVLTVSKRWNQDQKGRALQAMFLAATPHGALGPSQVTVLKQMRDILELTDGEYQSAIEQAVQWEIENE